MRTNSLIITAAVFAATALLPTTAFAQTESDVEARALEAQARTAQCPKLDAAAINVYRGVSIDDLGDKKQQAKELNDLAQQISLYVMLQNDLELAKVHSVSLHEFIAEPFSFVLDIFGRDPRFQLVNRGDHSDGGGTGFLRVQLHFQCGRAHVPYIVGHTIIAQHDYSRLSPEVTVSLGDRLAVLNDAETGFRRLFPLDVGAIDAVQQKGITSLLTPVSEYAVLDKMAAIRSREKPSYYLGKPFIAISVATSLGDDGMFSYKPTKVAFHIFQNNRFNRGFMSHGCMRMREPDLMEMYSLVRGVPSPTPIRLRVDHISYAEHPFPKMDRRYNAVYNAGTPEEPKAMRELDEEGANLIKLQTISGHVPDVEKITGTSLDPDSLRPLTPSLENGDDEAP